MIEDRRELVNDYDHPGNRGRIDEPEPHKCVWPYYDKDEPRVTVEFCLYVNRNEHDAYYPESHDQRRRAERSLHDFFENGKVGRREYGQDEGDNNCIADEPDLVFWRRGDQDVKEAEQGIEDGRKHERQPRGPERYFKVVFVKYLFNVFREP